MAQSINYGDKSQGKGLCVGVLVIEEVFGMDKFSVKVKKKKGYK